MKKQKGFTLIELLAIIVILAIIAVITVPIILGIVDEAKMKSAIDSAYGYKEAVSKLYASNVLMDSSYVLEDDTYTVSELEEEGLSISGAVPESNSWVTIVNSNVVSACLQFGDYKVTIADGRVESAVEGVCTIPFGGTYVAAASNSYYLGILYLNPTSLASTCNAELANLNRTVAGYKSGIKDGCMKWYVYSRNSDNNTVNAILDHNIVENRSWYYAPSSSYMTNRSGPLTVLQLLRENTANWETPEINRTYNTTYYTVTYNGDKARVITFEEISQKTYTTISGSYTYNFPGTTSGQSNFGCFGWLYDNLSNCAAKGCNEAGETTTNGSGNGYWTASAYNYSNNSKKALFVGAGYLGVHDSTIHVSNTAGHGIRPVIEIPEALLEAN